MRRHKNPIAHMAVSPHETFTLKGQDLFGMWRHPFNIMNKNNDFLKKMPTSYNHSRELDVVYSWQYENISPAHIWGPPKYTGQSHCGT